MRTVAGAIVPPLNASVRRHRKSMRKLLATILATTVVAICHAATSDDVEREYPPGTVAKWLSAWYQKQTPDLSMNVTWTVKASHEYLHCRLTNTSRRSIVVNREMLPWNAWVAITFVAFNAEGRITYWDDRPGSFPVPMAEPLVVGAGQSAEGDINFSTLPHSQVASREDVFLFWTARIWPFVKSVDAGHVSNTEAPALWVNGITFVPKRQSPKGR